MVEKLKSLLKFGITSTRFKDIFDFYYLINNEVLNKDNVFDEKAAPVVQKIDEINQRIENLKSSLEKE